MSPPIFFDPSGSRKRWTVRAVVAGILLVVATAVVFAITILDVPRGGDLPVRWGSARPAALHSKDARGHKGGQWLPAGNGKAGRSALTIGFYVPWDQSSASSLRRNIRDLDWVVPALVTVAGPDHAIRVQDDAPFASILAAAPRSPKVLPMVQNLADEKWDGAGVAKLVADPAARAKFAHDIAAMVTARKQAGVVMDFESLPPGAVPHYLALLARINAALPARKVLAVTVPAGDRDWDIKRFAAVADRLILMNYDQHWQGGTAGPIAAQPWFVDQLRDTVRQVGADKLIVAIGSYAYDWHGGKVDALSIEEAWLAAHDSEAPIQFDKASGNEAFAYDEDNGEHHEIWMMDAATTWNQLQAVRAMGVGSVALWRLGTEDSGVWPALQAFRNGGRPDLATLVSAGDVDVEGSGEILRVTASPTKGRRELSFDAAGIIRDVRYDTLPTPYVVSRTGAPPGLVALTFDDGPDPTYTPKMLDILKQANVPATFFIIGENALQHPLLLRRMVAEGHELGNHTYTHPNLALDSPRGTSIELNATQRLVQAYTGRGMRLFRAPYFGDAEPTTADELDPAMVAQQQGYTVVGLHADPDDWKRPGVDAIVQRAVSQVLAATPERSANIVLLHDGGGDRDQTVAALPRIIAALRARGYSFVPVSRLAGLSRDAVMPKIEGGDLLAVRADVAIFVILAGFAAALRWLFFVAIALGIARALILAGLALRQRGRERGEPPVHTPRVSVIIPAYNEERVIEGSIRRVLASDYPEIELIVADDGSKDATSAIVAREFGGDPRVKLLTLENGGKAAALNRALRSARGEVIIALDADTQFEPETIARLARWFVDPGLGAVAGNAQVGNRVNLVTRWQAVEYITAQNLERRALAGFNAITVVPGAVGAWRRAALDAVGGYPEDTLAEDQDLTIAIQRAGWRVTYDADAVAWTEAPETFKALAKQRYRWAFGTLQCLWKHRGIYRDRTARGLALVGLPQAWIFQIGFAAISPLIDLALVVAIGSTVLGVWRHGWEQTQGDVGTMAIYWLAFTAIDVGCGWIAYRLNSRKIRYPALLLVAQRFVYRQLMYWVVLRAISSAVGGWWVGWGKLERSGRMGTGAPAV